MDIVIYIVAAEKSSWEQLVSGEADKDMKDIRLKASSSYDS